MIFYEGQIIKIGLFKYLIIFFHLSLASQSAISQVNVDSLKQLVPDSKGKERLEILSKLTYVYSFSANDNYHRYAQEGLEYALSYGDSIFISQFLIELGYYHKYNGSYQDAFNNFNRVILIANKIDNNYYLGVANTGLGSVYHELGRYSDALECHLKSLSLKEKEGNKKQLGVSYNNIGLIYYKIDQPDKAQEYYEKSLKFKLEVGDTSGCIVNYINIGSVLFDKGSGFLAKIIEIGRPSSYEEELLSDVRLQNSINTDKANQNFDNAISNFKKAITMSLKYEKLHRLGYAYNGLSSVFAAKEEYDSAKYYLNSSIEESIKNNYRLLESSNYYLLSKIAYQELDYNLALNYLRRSQSILELVKDLSRIKNNNRLFSDIFEAKGMMDSAFYYQKEYSNLKDEIFKDELAKSLTELQITDATSEKDLKILVQEEKISKERSYTLILLSFLALSMALIIVIFRNYANTNKINRQLNESKNEIEAQKENLEKKNNLLAEAQVTIQKQNDVLKNINIDLDKKVKERTDELDKSNHELEKAVKDLDQFIYKTSHDLRGPIATMQGIINLGVMDSKDEKSKEYFTTLHNVSNNLNNVLYRLIEVHDTYLKKPILQNLDPMKEIIETTNRVSQFSIESDITIITELQANGQWNSDKVLFNMIVENMLRSAMLYKDRGDSMIKIKTQYKNDHLNIIFEDNGFGIQPGDEEKVFNIFFKGSPRPGGTGLEVYTAKIGVEKLGGQIVLKKPQKNTIFEIVLPILNN